MVQEDPAEKYPKRFEEAVRSVFRDLGISSDPVIKTPRSDQADLCLVCFPLARDLKKNPEEIAEEIRERMGDSELWTLGVNGGYLNCNFDESSYVRESGEYLWKEGEEFGKGERTGEFVIVEHTSANPNGPFHVGRARNPIIGDTLVRLLKMAGDDVEAQYWVNDMGKQAMILVWGLHNITEDELPEPEREKEDHILVRYYQAANARMEGSEQIESGINSLLKNYEEAMASGDMDKEISPPGSKPIKAVSVKEILNRVLDGMKESLEGMNVVLDRFVYESKVVRDGSMKSVIEGLKRSDLRREEDGANYLDLSEKIRGGGDDRFKKRFVFTKGDGSALYTTRDLAYHTWKLGRCDKAINVLGEDHRYQSTMLRLALEELDVGKVPEPIFYAFVSLPLGKMSTRRGRVVYLDDLIDEAVERAKKEVEKRRDYSREDLFRISKQVGIGALRFNMIKVQPEKKIVFRWEEAINFEGASAPFIQYSHARACSILRKSKVDVDDLEPEWTSLVEESERSHLRTLSRFPSLVKECAESRKPHLIAGYLVEAASSFNEFYRDCPVLNESDPKRRETRIALVEASRRVISNGLESLGIDAPPMM